MTAVSAFSAIGLRPIPRRDVGEADRRRGSRKAGKYEPFLSFGMASSILPARVSQPRSR
jgi:hypothetical protein